MSALHDATPSPSAISLCGLVMTAELGFAIMIGLLFSGVSRAMPCPRRVTRVRAEPAVRSR